MQNSVAVAIDEDLQTLNDLFQTLAENGARWFPKGDQADQLMQMVNQYETPWVQKYRAIKSEVQRIYNMLSNTQSDPRIRVTIAKKRLGQPIQVILRKKRPATMTIEEARQAAFLDAKQALTIVVSKSQLAEEALNELNDHFVDLSDEEREPDFFETRAAIATFFRSLLDISPLKKASPAKKVTKPKEASPAKLKKAPVKKAPVKKASPLKTKKRKP
jgi:hypothetical protein